MLENPSSKLYHLLKEISELPMDTSWEKAIAQIFEVDPEDMTEIFNRYVSMLNLFREVEVIVNENERLCTPVSTEHLSRVRYALIELNMNGTIRECKNILKYDTLTAMYYLSENISIYFKIEEKEIDSSKINDLISQLDNLIADIKNSELPKDLKSLLNRNLIKIKQSLDYYFVSGIEGIRDALESTIGSIIYNSQIVQPEYEDNTMQNVFKFMSRLNDFVSSVNGVKDIIAPITMLLLKK
ncbi:hypothetical protein MHH96_01200 [Niallia sp. FSL K6-0212]|uniref:hypothetical protein n=1 Tax=Niallia sp. FSL K6-0212 TaxID=2921423 RepID=UPI0030F72320